MFKQRKHYPLIATHFKRTEDPDIIAKWRVDSDLSHCLQNRMVTVYSSINPKLCREIYVDKNYMVVLWLKMIDYEYTYTRMDVYSFAK